MAGSYYAHDKLCFLHPLPVVQGLRALHGWLYSLLQDRIGSDRTRNKHRSGDRTTEASHFYEGGA
jgi:hypothetical protein